MLLEYMFAIFYFLNYAIRLVRAGLARRLNNP